MVWYILLGLDILLLLAFLFGPSYGTLWGRGRKP